MKKSILNVLSDSEELCSAAAMLQFLFNSQFQDNNSISTNDEVSENSKLASDDSSAINTKMNTTFTTSSKNGLKLPFLTPHNPDPNRFLISAEESRKIYVLQNPNESRAKFILRFPFLLQECFNSGHLAKMKYLLDDGFAEDGLMHMGTSPPLVGRNRIYESFCSNLKLSPDFYCIFYNIKKVKKRMITTIVNSFGTLPYSVASETTPNLYNFLGSSLENLDEAQKIQKQKYDLLRSQGKMIKFKRKAILYFIINREENKICKIMAKNASVEVFESI